MPSRPTRRRLNMTLLLIEIFVLSVAAMRLSRLLGLQRLTISAVFLAAGVVLYVLNNLLIRHYIAQRIPDFASTQEAAPGVQKWELTAGLGVVPRWVSHLGTLGIAAIITAVVPWVIAFFRP